jgi:hypothetical protein
VGGLSRSRASIGDLPVIVSCESVQGRADALNGTMQTTHAAIEASGVGATDREWLSGWELFVSNWAAYYPTVSDCSALFPFGANRAPATIQGELNSWADQLRQWQGQAVAKGIAIPGGVLPAETGADTSYFTTIMWLVFGLAGLAAGAFVLKETGVLRRGS